MNGPRRSTMSYFIQAISTCQLIVWVSSLSAQHTYGCNEEKLALYPKAVPMLGGSLVFISGPCLNTSNDVIRCDFGGAIVNGRVVSTSNATCVTPALFVSGVIDVRLSRDGGSNYFYVGSMVVVENQPSTVNFTNWTGKSSINLGNLTVTWDPTALTGIYVVKIIVYEFAVNVNNNFTWEPVYTISNETLNEAGRHEFVINHERSVNNSSPKVGAIGIFELVKADQADPSLEKRTIWSEIHPLNWLYPVNTTSWCKSWVTRELSELDDWLPHRSVCPCTERQARRDTGSYTAFLDCRHSSTDEECSSDRPGAMFCVTSNIPSPSGAGQECCYNNDGHLIEMGALGAGFSQRQHHRVSSPYPSAGFGPVPVLSHYLADTMPYLQCCVADPSGSEQLCDLYRSVRPPNNCYGYQPPQPSLAVGDPHFFTFDGLNYTFNGYGEFTLANFSEDEFILQARSLPIIETPNATIFKAVATKTNSSDVIHVESSQRKGMSVFFRREGRQFEELELDMTKTWYLPGVTVKLKDNLTADGLSVVFDNSIALKITTHDDALAILVTAPYRFKYKTQGMMGTWNDKPNDDLQKPDDVIVSANSSMETIFHEFGNLWRVQENASLFYYRKDYNQLSHTNYTYTPLLIEPTSSLDDRVSHVCGNDQLCAFDLLVTGSESFAAQTLYTIEQYRSTRTDLMPVTCQLVSLKNGNITLTNAMNASPGSLATFHCDPCFELRGPNYTSCGTNGTWLNPLPSCIAVPCDTSTAPSNGLLVGALVGSLLVVIVSCLIITSLAKRLRQRRRKRELQKRIDRLWSKNKDDLLMIRH